MVLAQQSPHPQLVGTLSIVVFQGWVHGEKRGCSCWASARWELLVLFSLLASTAATRLKHLLPFKFFPDAT